MKRVISFLLTIALLFGLVGTTGVQVFAENMEELPYIERIYMEGFPSYIVPGEATVPEMYVTEGGCYVTDVKWVDQDKNPVAAFAIDQEYYLAVSMKTDEYQFMGGALVTDQEFNHWADCVYISQQETVAYFQYPVVPYLYGWTEYLGVTFTHYLPGQEIPAVPEVDVEGGIVTEAYWTDMYFEPLTDTHFQEGVEYQFNLKIAAPEGYPFAEGAFDAHHVKGDWRSCGGHIDQTHTTATIQFTYEPRCINVYDVFVGGIPEEIWAGAAEVPDLYMKEDGVVSSNAYWVDKDFAPVTTLEDGKVYYLAVELEAVENYVFFENLNVYTDYREVTSIDRNSANQVIVYIRYSLGQDVGPVTVTLNEPAEGMDIANLTATLTGNVVLDKITVYNQTTEEWVSSGVFAPDCIYSIFYRVVPQEGYRFTNELNIDFDTPISASWGYSEDYLDIEVIFSTCQVIPSIDISATMPVAGGKVSDAVVSVPSGANYTIKEYVWYDAENWEKVEGTFQADHDYFLELQLEPKTGYAFDRKETSVYINGREVDWDNQWTNAYVYYRFSFFVNEICPENLPGEIKAGAVQTPQIYDDAGQVTVTKVQWEDTSHKKVTTLKDGKVYYLAITMKPASGKQFNTEIPLNELCYYINIDSYKYVSASEAVVYIRYSLEPDAGPITITLPTLKEGTDISKIIATVTGNATVKQTRVFKVTDYEYEPCTTGKLEANAVYAVQVELAAKSGYQLSHSTEILVNGYNAYDIYQSGDTMTLEVYCNTYPKITQVQLELEGVEVGKNIADVKVNLPEDAQYEVVLEWYDVTDDWNEATGAFQDMHKYEVGINLYAKEGYAFDSWVQVTINGQTNDCEIGGFGSSFNRWEYYSFCKPLDKVDIPALPASIKKGQTLTAEFTAPAGANYEYYAEWGIMNEGLVEKADKNAPYLLYFQVTAAPGYEFTQDTKVYIDGKETMDYIPSGGSDIVVYKLYNIGMKEISRIDLTVPEFSAGAKPGTATVPKDAKYTLEGMDWGFNYDGNANEIDTVDTFQKDTHIFISPVFTAKDGYVFDENVAVYINGVKMTHVRAVNFGSYAVQIFYMGQVGNQPVKLTTPKLTVSGTAITWEANGAATYEVYRATSKSGSYKLLKTVTAEGDLVTFVDESATAGKTYYYKVKAIHAAGSKYNSGNSAVSSVAYPLPAPEISMSYNATSGKPVISWTKVSGAKSYNVYRTDWEGFEAGKFTKIGNTKSTTYTDTKAEVGIEYFYRVVAVGSSSTYNSDYSNTYMGSAKCATPVLKVTVDKATGKPALSWGKITGAVSYSIYRQLSGEEDFSLIAEQTAVTFLDTTAPLDSQCTYYIQAVSTHEGCHSPYSNKVTEAVALGIPQVAGYIDVDGRPAFTWQAVEGAVKYEIYRSTKSTSGFKVIDTVEDLYAYVDQTASVGTTYYYQVVAAGENTKSKASTAVKLVPTCAVPNADITTDQKTGRPKISWEKVSGAKSYDIYYATSANGTYKKLTNTKSTSYIDTKLSVGATRYYKVRAVASKSACNSAFSRIVSGMGFCASPAVKTTVDAATGKPSLSWGKITGASAYRIFRLRTGYESDFVELTSVTGTSFVDTTAPIDTRCAYMVQAMHKTEGLSSAFSPVVEVVSGIARPTVKGSIDAATGKFVLTWQAVEGAVEYEVFRSTKSTSGFKSLGTVEGLSFEDASAPGKTYYYKVTAIGAVSKSADMTAVKLVGKCAAAVITVENAANGKPSISWEKVTGAKKYTVYRATSETGKYSKLGTTTKLTYVDSKATAGKTYFYKVVANASSSKYDGAYSNVVSCVVLCATPNVKVTYNAQGQPTISWSKVTGAKEYRIIYQTGYEGTGGRGCQACEDCEICEYYGCPGCDCADCICNNPYGLATCVTTTKTSYTFTDVNVGMFGWVEVIAVAADENCNSQAAEASIEGKPATVKVTGKVGASGKPVLTWKHGTDVIIYKVYRSTSSSKGFEYIGEVDLLGEEGEPAETQTYEDTTAVKGKTYYYKVVAKSWWNEGEMSSAVKVKSK